MALDNEHLSMVRQPGLTGKMPDLLKQIQKNTFSILSNQLESLFSECDNLFFELSCRAGSNNEQNLYFEAMRELRIKKAGACSLFQQVIEKYFYSCLSDKVPPPENDDISAESLSIVQEDDVEQRVAISSMVTRARADCQEVLYSLTTRLDYLIPSNKINCDNNPLDPRQICQAFSEACQILDIPIKARIIIYKQFERLLVNKLTQLYTHCNDLLINAGILPKISIDNKPQRQTSNSEDNQSNQESLEGNSYDLKELSQMFATLRKLGLNQNPSYHIYTNNPGPIMASSQLLSALNTYQANSDDSNLHELIHNILTQSNPQQPQALQQTDEDIVNLACMFFDFVLNDKNIPSSFLTLIGRLQSPILKIALRDHSFFTNAKHPARQLINELAAMGTGWEDEPENSEDKLYKKIELIVDSVIEDGSEQPQILAIKIAELNNLKLQLKRRSELVEKRTQQAAEGKARIRQAKKATHAILYQQLGNAVIPASMISFLIEHWRSVLAITHLKYGEESNEWLNSTQTSQDLIWCCQSLADEKSKQRLKKIKGDLLERLKQGLSRVTRSDDQLKQLIGDIEETIDTLQQDNQTVCQALSPQQVEELKNGAIIDKPWQQDNERASQKEPSNIQPDPDYEYIKKVEGLPVNSWLRYEDSVQQRTIRCKLAMYIEGDDSYIFVNRFGHQVLEKTRKEFAYDLQKKRVVPFEKGLLFDRAMSTIISEIKSK